MSAHTTHERLDSIAAATAGRDDTNEVRFGARMPGLDWSWIEQDAREQYFIASITKLATAALVFQLIDDGAFQLSTAARDVAPAGTLDGLHTSDGVDRSAEITVQHLLAHTSGIPDYFENSKDPQSQMLARMLTEDIGWTRDEALDVARGQQPTRSPGDDGRAYYSDTNYQVLQAVIETTLGIPYAVAVEQRIAAPLGLEDTYVFTPSTIERFDTVAGFLHGRTPLSIPRAMASVGADGGIVSTVADQLAFGEAFFGARLFSPGLLAQATGTFRRLFFPLEYGIGVMRFRLPRAMNPWRPMPPLLGHSGATGAVLFHDPARQLTIAGAVNQLKDRALVYRSLSRLERALR